MALKTAGTNATTTLKAIQWQPAGMNQTDFATLMASIRNPETGAYGAAAVTHTAWVENGILFLPGMIAPQGIQLSPGDWICVDGAGWPIVISDEIFATSWTHS